MFETLPHAPALNMLSEARMYTADELEKNGWATKVVETEGEIGLFFTAMKKIRPEVHRAYKEMAIRKWRQSNLKERVDLEIMRCAELWAEDVHHQAVKGFIDKKLI